MRTGRHSRGAPLQIPMNPVEHKAQLRRQLRQQRALLPALERHKIQMAVIAQVRRYLKPGKKIAAYIPCGSEFSTWPLMLKALQRGVKLYLPQVPKQGKTLRFVRFDHAAQWSLGAYAIPEPNHHETCPPRALDVVFMPLVGFDSRHGRLGQGGGFYDTTFAFRRSRRHYKRPLLIALAFECQRHDFLPTEVWDVQPDLIFTGINRY